jgi:hypothetical protein
VHLLCFSYEQEHEQYENASEHVTHSVCGVPYEHYRSKVTHGIGRTAVEQGREYNVIEEEIRNQHGIKGDSGRISQIDL